MAGKADLKVAVLGNEASGKTALLERFVHERFEHNLSTAGDGGGEYTSKRVNIEGGRFVTLGIWDTSVAMKYEAMARVYYRGADAVVICFDLINDKSFQKMKFWMKDVQLYGEKCAVYMCGTKCDLAERADDVRVIETDAATAYANEMSAKYIETSSRTGHNVEELFRMIAEDFIKSQKKISPSTDDSHRGIQACKTLYNKIFHRKRRGL